jgi:hypothetical protein
MMGCGRSRGRRAEGEATGVLRIKFVLIFILFSSRDYVLKGAASYYARFFSFANEWFLF